MKKNNLGKKDKDKMFLKAKGKPPGNVFFGKHWPPLFYHFQGPKTSWIQGGDGRKEGHKVWY